MTKLVIVIGDYSGGTVESALHNGESLAGLRSADSADGRVFNELIRQDPSIRHIITLPVARQFSPNSAGAITKHALQWAFDLLEHPGSHPGYEDVTDVSIMVNVAPGIKSLSGGNVGQHGNNQDRESFVSGTVSKNGRTIVLGCTNAFLDCEGHTLGPVTELAHQGYTLSDFKAIGGAYAQEQLRINGQFRSRWALAYMNAQGAAMELQGEDILPVARSQNILVPLTLKRKDEQEAQKVFTCMKQFVPVRTGDAAQGLVTVISSAAQLDRKLDHWHSAMPDCLANGLSFDGNETRDDRRLIETLPPETQEKYRMTRQAFLAANLANEFIPGQGIGSRTVVIDSEESPLAQGKIYDATLTNGAHIITGNLALLALTLDTIQGIRLNGQPIAQEELSPLLTQAHYFRNYLKDKAVENDSYRNVKLSETFGAKLDCIRRQLQEITGSDRIPEDKIAALTMIAKTGDLEEERTVYYVPSSAGGFGTWGHAKLSSGSTLLNPTRREKTDFQAELFTPGCPTAGNVFTVIPGVTSLAISQVALVDKSLLETPSTRLTGTNRTLGHAEPVAHATHYHRLHARHVGNILNAAAMAP